jgi:hypothetical protein
MSEENLDLNQLKKLHAQYVFIHQALTQRLQYYPDEFEIAKDAVQTITAMANNLSDKIQSMLPPEPPDDANAAKVPDAEEVMFEVA